MQRLRNTPAWVRSGISLAAGFAFVGSIFLLASRNYLPAAVVFALAFVFGRLYWLSDPPPGTRSTWDEHN